MKKTILISNTLPNIWEMIERELFMIERELFPVGATPGSRLQNTRIAYMPVKGDDPNNKKYTPAWKELAERNGAELVYIDNSVGNDKPNVGAEASFDSAQDDTLHQQSDQEQQKLLDCNILIMTGGNVYHLLRNLRSSGLDSAIKKFFEKENYIFVGMSAGAMILTPKIAIGNLAPFNENDIDLDDDTGLGILDFEIFCHWQDEYQELLTNYETENYILKLRDEEYVVLGE